MKILPLIALAFAPAPSPGSYTQNSDGTTGLGLSPSFSRLPSELLRALVVDYVEGARDAAGAAVPEALQKQLRPATLAPGNYEIGAPTVTVFTVSPGANDSVPEAPGLRGGVSVP